MQTIFVILIVLFSIAFLSESIGTMGFSSTKKFFPVWILFLGGVSVFICIVTTLMLFTIVPEKNNEIENLKKQLNEKCPQYEEVNETLYKKK